MQFLKENEPKILIECKQVNMELKKEHMSQLYRYFSITDVRLGILTNGIHYQFFADSKEKNRMDETPFLDIHLDDISKREIKKLEKFQKEKFDLNNILSTVDNLKYISEIKKCLFSELEDPSDEFVKTIVKQFYEGVLTKKARKRFKKMIIKVSQEVINDKVDKRLKEVVKQIESSSIEEEVHISVEKVTSNEELEAFYIIKSILSEIIPTERVAMRNRKNYCGILLDDNHNYTICRLYFNNLDNLSVLFYDSLKKNDKGRKVGNRVYIKQPSDLYNYKKELIKTVEQYVLIKDKK